VRDLVEKRYTISWGGLIIDTQGQFLYISTLKSEGVKIFFWFTRFPIVRDRGMVDRKRRVEFIDLHFGSINKRRPFVYVVDFDQPGRRGFKGFCKHSAKMAGGMIRGGDGLTLSLLS
jgi:hypothetical protein